MSEKLTPKSIQDNIIVYIGGLMNGVTSNGRNTVQAAIHSADSFREKIVYQTYRQRKEIYHLYVAGIQGEFPQAELRILLNPLKSVWVVDFIMQRETPPPGVNFKEPPDNELVMSWAGKKGKESDTFFVNCVGRKSILIGFNNRSVKIDTWGREEQANLRLDENDLNNKLEQIQDKTGDGVIFLGIKLVGPMLSLLYSGFPSPESIDQILVPQRISLKTA